MKNMILEEVRNFRAQVRNQPLHVMGGHAPQGGNVPIPDNQAYGRSDEPKPQEAGADVGGLNGVFVGMDGVVRH